MNEKDAEIARIALEILDRDGWCKGSVCIDYPGASYPLGSHCLGGAWAIAAGTELHCDNAPLFESLIQVIRDQRPGIDDMIEDVFRGELNLQDIRVITLFNDLIASTEDDVRVILEKIAAQ